jgi:hypothetical protein
MKYQLKLILALVAVCATGCVHIANVPQGKIVSVTERGIGFVVSQSVTTQTPEVKFGFFSSAIVILPTSTNVPTYAPNFANKFDFAQTSALNIGIGETIASGNYQTFQPGATNSAPTAQPIVPH